MTFNPRKTNYLTPSQECVMAYLSTTNYWRTAREVALAIGIAEKGANSIILELVKAGVVQKRKRDYGFDADLLEYKAKPSSVITKRRARARQDAIIGFEPIHAKLRKHLGAKRAKEVEGILKLQ